MKDFEFTSSQLSPNEMKKILIGSVIPRPIALISSQSQGYPLNIAPFSYFNIVSYNPGIVSVAVQTRDGVSKDTARNILASGEAVLHIVDADNVEEANRSAANLSAEEGELALTNFQTVASKFVNVPGLKPSKVRFECKLYAHQAIHNHSQQLTADVIFLEIIHSYISEEVYDEDRHYLLADKLAPVSRLAGNDYAYLGELFSLDRPD